MELLLDYLVMHVVYYSDDNSSHMPPVLGVRGVISEKMPDQLQQTSHQ